MIQAAVLILITAIKQFIDFFHMEKLKKIFSQNIKNQLIQLKEALAQEGDETKEMFKIYFKYTRGEATTAQMNEANAQFRDFLKTIGLGALAILPLAPITIPFIVKLGQKFGVDVIPSSFKNMKKK